MTNRKDAAAKTRDEKRAQALRENLKKRKRQKEAWGAEKDKKEG